MKTFKLSDAGQLKEIAVNPRYVVFALEYSEGETTLFLAAGVTGEKWTVKGNLRDVTKKLNGTLKEVDS